MIYHYCAHYQIPGEYSNVYIDGIITTLSPIDSMERYRGAKLAICSAHADILVINSLSLLDASRPTADVGHSKEGL